MLVAETRKSPMHLPLNVWPGLASSFWVELELDPLTHKKAIGLYQPNFEPLYDVCIEHLYVSIVLT